MSLTHLFLAVTALAACFGLWQITAYIVTLHRLVPAEES